jgi:hypothetical protein
MKYTIDEMFQACESIFTDEEKRVIAVCIEKVKKFRMLEAQMKELGIRLPTPTKKKNPMAPKKPKGAYIYYSIEFRDEVINELKEEVENMNGRELSRQIFKRMGERWNALESKDKEKYVNMAKKDKEKYDNEMSEYNK